MTYTEEQIKIVCDKAASLLKEFSDMKTCPFPATPIIEGMKEGLIPDEIGAQAYQAISKLPFNQAVSEEIAKESMRNIATFMKGRIIRYVNEAIIN